MKSRITRTIEPTFSSRWGGKIKITPKDEPRFAKLKQKYELWKMLFSADADVLIDESMARNLRDYRLSPIKAIEPEALIALFPHP